MASACAAEAAQMLIRKTEEAQEKSRTSRCHQTQCRSFLVVRNEPVAGKPGISDSAGEDRSKSAVYAVRRKVRKLEAVRCGYLKACVGLVHHQV